MSLKEGKQDSGCQQFSLGGGDLHQLSDQNHGILTTQQGVPISDDQNTLKMGSRGPALMEDFIFREKLTHFDHERIPERIVHARGVGAHGYFENYENISELTCADIFQRGGEKTPVFVRFSTVIGSKGSPDLPRDIRGFATKFFTKQGVWDLVGNNMPVFFIQDAIKFPDFVHAAKEEPDKGFPQASTAHDSFWDFVSLMPESTHAVMWAMSDRALPRSLRTMEGFGVNTYRFVNERAESKFIKFHWKPKIGLQSLTWNECMKINGADPDYHHRDLWNAINNGDYPEWELGVQIMDESIAKEFQFDLLDATKLVPEEEVPVKIIGKLVLDKNPENVFLETEQVAFCSTHIIPGIDFSNDPNLQGRNFSYLDTQISRIGPNFAQLPINAPKCPMSTFQQDGKMAIRNVLGANYEPNSLTEKSGPRESMKTGFRTVPELVSDADLTKKIRSRYESFADHYSQARQFYESQTLGE
jgi:catalase